MTSPEQSPNEGAGRPKRILLISCIVVLCVLLVLGAYWYLTRDISNQTQEWWNEICGSGPYDPSGPDKPTGGEDSSGGETVDPGSL